MAPTERPMALWILIQGLYIIWKILNMHGNGGLVGEHANLQSHSISGKVADTNRKLMCHGEQPFP